MNAMRSFVLAGMLAASNTVATVQASEPLVLHAGKAAISIEVPSGWKVRTLERRISGAEPLVELTQAGVSALDAPFRIQLVYYKSQVPVVARERWEASVKLTNRRTNFDLPEWLLTEAPGSAINAYVPLGSDVVVVSLKDLGSGRYDEGKAALLSVIQSYKEVGDQ
jgi:hypothetical protein